MYTVYVLYSESYQKIYIGYTSSMEQRLRSHNELSTKGYTFRFRPWKLVYSEVFETKSEALQREKSLKSAKGRAFIWELIRNG